VVLVDTSVWVDHLRDAEPQLQGLLRSGQVLMHPLIVGELACGNLANRNETLDLFLSLPSATEASHAEALTAIQERKLHGTGVGIVDVHLLASCLLTHVPLWTRDRKLAPVVKRLGLEYKA